MDRVRVEVVATVMHMDQVADRIFATPGLQFAVVQGHRLRSGSATLFAVAARSLNNKFNNRLFNHHPLRLRRFRDQECLARLAQTRLDG